ncbi:hypothetical protein QR680_018022 [Steinernema hermaphroditum]|uniref:G-protein coupled receptors family 1 profile domain-containing protein n=1 Tax=Steinernema hermaphroditum TaxID=289476 RepID=A0AA39HHY0_9BILA|nr:hypothetical protein QR680_018022 [Steinernema hermaphroditum]
MHMPLVIYDPMAASESVVTIVGALYIVLSSIFFVLNLILFVIMFKNSEYQTATYRIIRYICLACMIQLTIFMIGGVMTLTDSTFEDHLNKIFGAILQSAWFLYLGLSFSLAVDRLLCFVIISPKKCSVVSALVLAASFLVALIYLVAFLIPGFGFGYCCTHQLLHWFYMVEPGADVLKKSEVIVDFVILSLVLVFYCTVFFFLMKMRKKNLKNNVNTQSFKMELRILVIAIVSFVYEATYLLWFFWGSNFLADSSYRHIVTTLLWIVECGQFALSTVTINSYVCPKTCENAFDVNDHYCDHSD